jgi:hypothetical protein
MDPDVRHLVQAIHDSPSRAVFVSAGAGGQALADLLGVAGASRTLLEALVPYAVASFSQFLGREPDQYVAAGTARCLAGRALARARSLRAEEYPIVGLACTATIVTDRPKKGEHRAHVAAWSAERVSSHSLTLEKGARDRAGEEGLVSRLILNALAGASGLDERLALDVGPGDSLNQETTDLAAAAVELLDGRRSVFGISDDGRLLGPDERPAALLSGSFNPLHEGHLGLAAVAAGMLGAPVAFEISAANVDKPPLEAAVLLDRMSQFAGAQAVYASNAPTFVEKSPLYPGATFVVGYDTAARVIAPRYYGDSHEAMLAALAEMQARGNHFLVAGRLDSAGAFQELEDLVLPTGYSGLFSAIPDELFRRDISSTELRARQEKR